MELTGKREVLAEAFAIAQAIATARSTRPVLQNLLLNATKQGVEVAATDMEIGLRIKVPVEDCEVKKEGQALISASRVAQIARIVESEKITITRRESSCVVKAGRSVFDVVTENVEDFPQIAEPPAKSAIEIEAGTFASMTKKTVFAAAREATRYSLNGVHIETKDGYLEMVATDGRRLALVREKVGKDVKLPAAIVPQKAIAFVERLRNDGDEKFAVAIADRQIFFTGPRGTIVSRLVEGHFPPYNEVIPRDTTRKATIAREALLSVMRQSLLMTSEESKSALLSFTAGELIVTSKAPDEGSSEVWADVKYDGEPMEIRFNPQFIIDGLTVSNSAEITIEMKEPSTPAVIKDGTGFLYVVMPIYIV